jgi:hypothetical protein
MKPAYNACVNDQCSGEQSVVRQRHFIVHEVSGSYSLREIEAYLAESVSRYGVTTTEYYCGDGGQECWYFYFMNAHFSSDEQRRAAVASLVELVPAQ